jgi:DNA-directed RNA polymerase specialized sigma24 family protein
MPELESNPSAGAFCATQWSVVLEARNDSGHRREALERLCRTYWLPVYGYLRRRGHAAPDAEDLTQGFFAYLLGSDFLQRPDPARGRFRGYLIGALRHYLGTHFERANAQRRGGGAQFLDWNQLDAEREFAALDQPQRDPSEVYETGWALALLGRAMERLASEQGTPAKAQQFAVLRPFLSAAADRGGYDQAALALGTTRTNVAVWVHRLNHRYGELVKLEVAATVHDPAEVKHEMQHLLQALRR